VVVVVVDHTNYIAKSRASLEALKSANLLKSLNINALILGESGTGKETLAKFILPEAKVIDASNFQEIVSYIGTNSSIIIKNFDKISNLNRLKTILEENTTRVIATSKFELSEKSISDFFALMITIPPLTQREEDIEPLKEKFFEEVSSIFGDSKNISLKDLKIDLSNNCHSLKKSVYTRYLINSFDEDDVMQVMEEFLIDYKDKYKLQ